jgi:hypothetical protein
MKIRIKNKNKKLKKNNEGFTRRTQKRGKMKTYEIQSAMEEN